MISKLRCKKGEVSVDMITGLLIFVILFFFFTLLISYSVRTVSYNYTTDYLKNAVNKTCKTASLTPEIISELEEKLDKMFPRNNYVLTYKYQSFGSTTKSDLTSGTKLYVGDTVFIQFNLNIPKAGATKEQLKMQPLFTRLCNFIVRDNSKVDRLLQVEEGMVESNAR